MTLGKFLRHLRNICTIKFFPMKKFERSVDSKLHPCIGCWWLLTAKKIINLQNLNHRFLQLLGFCHFRKKNLPPFFVVDENQFFCKSEILILGLIKSYSGICCQTVTNNEWKWPKDFIIIQKLMFWKSFQVSGSDETPVPGVTKLRFVFTRCPLLFTYLLNSSTVALMQKNKKIGQVNSLKKKHQS